MKLSSIFKYFSIMSIVFAFSVVFATAQSSDEINKVEGFAGYTYNSIDTGFDSEDFDDEFGDVIGDRTGTHGFNGAVNVNFSKYIGAKFDFSTASTSESDSFTDPEFGTFDIEAKYRVTNYLGGIQLKNNLKDGARFKPFAHVLAGVAHQKVTLSGSAVEDFTGQDSISEGQTDFAMVFGGGIDVKLNKNIDLRLIQLDYNPIFMKDRTFEDFTFEGRTLNNFRISIGLVFH